jgi:hypothetical protein
VTRPKRLEFSKQHLADSWTATEREIAMVAFSCLPELMADIADPFRPEGKLYKLPHLLLFANLAIISGATCIAVPPPSSMRCAPGSTSSSALNSDTLPRKLRSPSSSGVSIRLRRDWYSATMQQRFTPAAQPSARPTLVSTARPCAAIENMSPDLCEATLGEGRSRIRTNTGVFARQRRFYFNIHKTNRTVKMR